MDEGNAPGQGAVDFTFHPEPGQRPVYKAGLWNAVSVIDTWMLAKLRTGIDLKLLLPMLSSEINSSVLGLTPVSCFSVG